MERFENNIYEGERAMYNKHDAFFNNCVFQNGESPLKACSNIIVENSTFSWKYPMWYSNNITVNNCTLLEMARSGIWYTTNITFNRCNIVAPKLFRRASKIVLYNIDLHNAQETLWNCEDIEINNMHAVGDYFGMNSNNIRINDFKLDGNYAFDGASNIEIHNAYMNSKDSFWKCENVIVYDSTIIGEYIGWNSRNLTFVNCHIESNQGLCYIEGLKMINCTLENTDLCFERCSNIDADIKGHVISIKNPYNGIIKVDSVDEIILHDDIVDKSKTKIIIGE